jgi:Mn-dependent DtxR family transcriptional regulator
MTARQVAAALRMQAHSLTVALKKLEEADKIEYESLMLFTLQVIEQYANDKVAQALMLENLAHQLEGIQFDTLDKCVDLTPLGTPPVDID